MRYEVFGPFPFCTTKGVRHRKALGQFWADRNEDGSPENLCDAVGVYVWTIKEGGRRIPWNVGITSRQGFKGRFPQKETTFLRFLGDHPHAEIEVYLLARRSKEGKFSKSSQTKLNNWLETVLIGAAISVNPDLRNTAKSKYLRDTIIDGYLNDREEERSESARSFGALFKAPSRKRN
ncbi:MAG: hypothetical protein P4L10_09390 [Acidobacteriaceae bacterium]|nr:hypothetical protein [Acidobacteriaceae bacterium]